MRGMVAAAHATMAMAFRANHHPMMDMWGSCHQMMALMATGLLGVAVTDVMVAVVNSLSKKTPHAPLINNVVCPNRCWSILNNSLSPCPMYLQSTSKLWNLLCHNLLSIVSSFSHLINYRTLFQRCLSFPIFLNPSQKSLPHHCTKKFNNIYYLII